MHRDDAVQTKIKNQPYGAGSFYIFSKSKTLRGQLILKRILISNSLKQRYTEHTSQNMTIVRYRHDLLRKVKKETTGITLQDDHYKAHSASIQKFF